MIDGNYTINGISLTNGGSCLLTIDELAGFSYGFALLDLGYIQYAFKAFRTKNPKMVYIDVPAMRGIISAGEYDSVLTIYQEDTNKILHISLLLRFVDNCTSFPDLAILIPAVIDPECNKLNAESIKQKILNANRETFFKIFVNIDHIVPKYLKNEPRLEETINIYNSLKTENSKIEIQINNPNLGITKSIHNLYKKFEQEGIKNALVLDDDQEILEEIFIEPILKVQNSILNSVIVLNGTKQTNVDQKNGQSVQTFNEENILIKNKNFNLAIVANEILSFVSPGSFLTREHVTKILQEYRPEIGINNEDQISNMPWFKTAGVATFYRYKNEKILNEPIILDRIRCYKKNDEKKERQKLMEEKYY